MKTPLKTIPEQRKVRELPRKMNLQEVEEPETTKIHMQNPFTPLAATPKVRELPRKTNVEARNHEKSDEFRPAPPFYCRRGWPMVRCTGTHTGEAPPYSRGNWDLFLTTKWRPQQSHKNTPWRLCLSSGFGFWFGSCRLRRGFWSHGFTLHKYKCHQNLKLLKRQAIYKTSTPNPSKHEKNPAPVHSLSNLFKNTKDMCHWLQ